MNSFKIDQDEIIDYLENEGFFVSRDTKDLIDKIISIGLVRSVLEQSSIEDVIIFLENSGYTVTWNNDNSPKDISEEHKLLLWKLYDEMKLSTPEQFIQIVDKILQKELQKWL